MRLKRRVAKLEDAAQAQREIDEFTMTPEDRERVGRLIDDILANPEENPGDYEIIQRVMGLSDEEQQAQA